MKKPLNQTTATPRSRTPRGYVPKRHYGDNPADTVPAHRLPLVKLLGHHMERCRINMLHLNALLGYSGRSAISMVMAGHRGIPLDRVDDFARVLRLTAAEREELRIAAVHAGSSPEAFILFLKAQRPGAIVDMPVAPPAAPQRTLFQG